MTAYNGKPCKKCSTSDWDKHGNCRKCKRERHSQWAKDNPDKMLAAVRQWQQENPDKKTRYGRKWNHNNPEKRTAIAQRYRTQKTQAGGGYTAAEFKEMCNHYGNKCLRCGRDDVKLTFDHVLPVSMGGTSDISNGQPLCGKCNSAKNNRHIDYRPDAGLLRWLQCKLFG